MRCRYPAVAAVALWLLGTVPAGSSDYGVVELQTEAAVRADAALQIQVTTGPLPRGARVSLSTEDGRILGAVTPFPQGASESRATVPVPAEAVAGRRLRLHLQVTGPSFAPRAPARGEVTGLRLLQVPGG